MTDFAKILKFNPYHDEGGRFSSEDGHTFMSTSPLFAKSVARHKAKHAVQLKAAEDAALAEWDALMAVEKAKKTNHIFTHASKQSYVGLEQLSTDLNKETEDDYQKLSNTEKSALKKYTGPWSGSMNVASGKAAGDDSQISVYDKPLIKSMDAVFRKMKTKRDMTVFRAGSLQRMGGDFAGLNSDSTAADFEKLVGKTFTEHSYASSSTSVGVAEGFKSSKRVMMEIDVPKGSSGAWVGGNANRGAHPSEQELVLPRGNQYIVTGVSIRPHPFGDGTVTMVKIGLIGEAAHTKAKEKKTPAAKPTVKYEFRDILDCL